MAVEPTPPPSLRYQDVVAAFIVDPNVCTDADPKEPFRILCTLRKTDAKYFANLWEYPGETLTHVCSTRSFSDK